MTTTSNAAAPEIRAKAYSIETTFGRNWATFETPEQLAQALNIEVPEGLSEVALIELLLKNKDWNITLCEFNTRAGQSEKFTGGTCDELYTASDIEERHGHNSTASYTRGELAELQGQLAEAQANEDAEEVKRLMALINEVQALEEGQTAVYWPGTPVDSPEVFEARFTAYGHDVHYYRLLCAVEIEEETDEDNA